MSSLFEYLQTILPNRPEFTDPENSIFEAEGYDAIETLVDNMRIASDVVAIVEESGTGQWTRNDSDGEMEHTPYSLLLLQKARITVASERKAAMLAMKGLGLSIFAEMLTQASIEWADDDEEKTPAGAIDFSQITFIKRPAVGDGRCGYEFVFTLRDDIALNV